MRRNERGISLIEVAIVLIVISVLSVMIVQSIKGLATTQTYTRGQARVLEVADRVAQDIARDVRFAVRAYNETPRQRLFLDYLQLDEGMLAETTRMPITSEIGMFDVDPTGKPLTGNVMFMVTALPNLVIDISMVRSN